ncbi:MAG TPA: PAS domain-containing protein, partial [Rhodanobacteraceae bacterium]
LKNEAFSQRLWGEAIATLDDLGGAFTDAEQARAMLKTLRAERRAWRGELEIADRDGAVTAVGVRADTVIGTYGLLLGFILIFDDLTESKRADLARIHLQDALFRVARIESAEAGMGADSDPPDGVIGAILANARLAALDISDGRSGESVAPLIEELRTATQRATALYAQLRAHGFDGAGADDSARDPA